MLIHKFLLFFLLITTLSSKEIFNKVGFIVYNSNKWDNSFLKTKRYDIYNNGLYSVLDFNLGPINLYSSIFASVDSIEANKGGTSKPVYKFFGYTSRAYLKTTLNSGGLLNNILFGRDFINIGNGYFDQLFIGKNSRPFDQISWNYKYKDIFGSSGIIQLDNIGENKRYLSYHTLGLNKGNISLSIAEAILFTGINRTIDWTLINPVLMWLPEMHNQNSSGNALIYIGLSYNYSSSLKFWMDALIDDYQLVIGSWGDRLEPNNYGITLGIEKKNWFFSGSKLIGEYTLITNQTYQTHTAEEIFMHRGYTIGHYLGNDFDLFSLTHQKSIYKNRFVPFISIGYLRDRANGIEIQYSKPWMQEENLINGNYTEKRPTGPINYNLQIEVSADFILKENSWLNFGIIYNNLEKIDDFSIIFRLHLEFNNYFKY